MSTDQSFPSSTSTSPPPYHPQLWAPGLFNHHLRGRIETSDTVTNVSRLFSPPCRIIAKIDDEMLSYYCNEDIFLLEVRQVEEDHLYNITFTELMN